MLACVHGGVAHLSIDELKLRRRRWHAQQRHADSDGEFREPELGGRSPLLLGGTLDIQLEDGSIFEIDLAAIMALGQRDQARALAAMKEIEAKLLWNPLLRYAPASCATFHQPGRPCTPDCKHASFHRAWENLKAFFGGNRAGKTTTSIVDDIIQMTPDELLPPRLREFKKWDCPFYCRVMTPDMQRTMVPVIYEKLREWVPKDLLKGGSFDRSFDKQAASLRLECGCRFDFMSYEMDLNKFGGAALHRCHYDETPPASIRKECLMRLVDYNGDEVFSLTPLKGLDFTWREVWKQRKQIGGDPNIFAIQVGMDDNPHLSSTARSRILASITDEKELAARRDGHFMHDSGMVYPGFTAILAKRWPDETIRAAAEKLVNIDPGIRYAGISYIAVDEENMTHTWRAVKLKDAVASDYRDEIVTNLRDVGLELDDVRCVIDPAAVQRGLAKGENILDELAELGIFCELANNDVPFGVRQIRRRIRNGHIEIADPEQGGETRDLVDELEEYVLDIDEDADDGEFKVKKINDHVADSWRYGHAATPWDPADAILPDPDAGVPWWAKADHPRNHIGRAEPPASVAGAMV